MPTTAFYRMVADPQIFVGGGSVAALTGAGAGSTALLVMRLNARRKSLKSVKPAILDAVARVESIVAACEDVADEDIDILAKLLEAHRESRNSGNASQYVLALTAAAESSLKIATIVIDLMSVIDEQVSISTRFTVSDLGAAAVLAAGACRAALLTAEVNVALLQEHPEAEWDVVHALAARREALFELAISLGDDIEARTRTRLHGDRSSKGSM